MNVLHKAHVFGVTTRVPLANVDSVRVDLFEAFGGGFVGFVVSISICLRTRACLDVVWGGVAFDLAAGDRVWSSCDDAAEESAREVAVFLHVPWLTEGAPAMEFLESSYRV